MNRPHSLGGPYTVASLSEFLSVSRSTIYRWIRKGNLVSQTTPEGPTIPLDHPNSQFIYDRLRQKYTRRRPHVPSEIRRYHSWHTVLDQLCWLVKVCYSSARDVRARQFRMETIFANYIRNNRIHTSTIRPAFASNTAPNLRLVTADLKRGWYNELAYANPVKPSTLGVAFRDIFINELVVRTRLAFPSWRIITAYYAIYFYLRGITLLKTSAFNLSQHNATISTFNNSVASAVSPVALKFPLDISYRPNARVFKRNLPTKQLPHLKYKYSQYPRTPNPAPPALFDNIYNTFRRAGRSGRRPQAYSLFDFLRHFRVWANYQEIENLLNLWGSGYIGFLDQNLSLLQFLIGGISELCYIATFTPVSYLVNLQDFYNRLTAQNPELEAMFENSPLFQRATVFARLGIVHDEIHLSRPPNVNALVIPQ